MDVKRLATGAPNDPYHLLADGERLSAFEDPESLQLSRNHTTGVLNMKER